MVMKVRQNLNEVIELCRAYRVKQLDLFGSASSGEDFLPETSDLDFLIEFQPMSPKEHARAYFDLLEKLQDLFRCSIDLVEIKAVRNPYFLEEANRSRTELYVA